MAEGSRDQGVATTDSEEDSPNMIVYRKVRLTVCVCYLTFIIGQTFAAMPRRPAPDSPLVRVSGYLETFLKPAQRPLSSLDLLPTDVLCHHLSRTLQPSNVLISCRSHQ